MIPKASDVVGALERRFNPKAPVRQYATFTELTDEGNKRRIDFLAVNLWLSRGRIVEGVEVKVRREDWMKELRQPKADSWFRVANRWWVAAPQGVVKVSEVPAGWGFLEVLRGPRSWKLVEKVVAPALSPAEDWPQWLVLRLLGRSEEKRQATPEEVAEATKMAFERGRAEGVRVTEARSRRGDGDPEEQLHELLRVLGIGSYVPRDRRVADVRLALELIEQGRTQWTAEHLIERYASAIAKVREAMIAAEDIAEPEKPLF